LANLLIGQPANQIFMNNHFLRRLQLSLAALDLISINLVYFFSELLLRKEFFAEAYVQYSYFGFYLNFAWVIVSVVSNMYHAKYILSFEQFSRRSIRAVFCFLGVIIGYLYFFHQFILSRTFITVILVSLPLALLFNRIFYLLGYKYFRNRKYLVNKVVILGYNNLSKKLVNYLEEDGINKKIIGFCDEYKEIKELSNYPILSDLAHVMETCKKYGATEIYSTIAPEHNPSIYNLIAIADQNCIRFKIVPDISLFVKRQMHIDYLNEIPVVSLRQEPLEDLDSRIRKRLFDLAVSSLVIIFILSWLIPLLGLLIWIESKGPIFFIQPRSGKDNKIFGCFKFRSMRVNAAANEQQAIKRDARITRVGNFLRRTSLDEMPQFLNVLMGHMSVVGPRPHMVKHTDQYSKLIGQYMVRQFLKPGITGWAQINGFRGETQTVEKMEKRVEHDLWYLENWSLWLDFKIICLTAFGVIKGDKEAF
jgi:putative colanic acid biosynthesis UDP-glucose lipid carrier transferase